MSPGKWGTPKKKKENQATTDKHRRVSRPRVEGGKVREGELTQGKKKNVRPSSAFNAKDKKSPLRMNKGKGKRKNGKNAQHCKKLSMNNDIKRTERKGKQGEKQMRRKGGKKGRPKCRKKWAASLTGHFKVQYAGGEILSAKRK